MKLGSGSLTLTATNTYTGGTTISAGTLTGNSASLQGNIVNNGALAFDQSGSGTFSGQISGSGSVAMVGSGTLTLGGQQSFTGGVSVSNGELRLGSAGAINQFGANTVAMSGTGVLSLNGHTVTVAGLSGSSGTVRNDSATAATLVVNQGSGSASFAGTLADGTGGALTLRKAGGGELTLGGNNTHTGGTELRAGTIVASHANALGAGTATVTNGTLLADGGLTIANPIRVNPPTGSVLVAGWDFQTTTNGGAAVLASPNTPTTFIANFGEGAIFLNGTNGSSAWAADQLSGFEGTTVNAGTGFSPVTTSPASLALVNQTANGQFAVFRVDMSYLEDLAISYATQRTSTGFNSQAWSISTDGVNWTNLETITDIPSSFVARSLSSTSGLDGSATAYVRVQVDGNTSPSGNNRLDNIQFNATSNAVATVGSSATSGTTTFSGDVTLDGPARLTSAAGGTVVFSGTIANGSNGAQGITTVGGGIVELTSANTYTGPTTVQAGTLALTGSGGIASSGVITVENGAGLDVSGVSSGPWQLGATTAQRLQGSGTVTGATTIAANGTHAPTGTQHFANDLTYASGSIFEWSLSESSVSNGFAKVTSDGTVVAASGSVFHVLLNGTALTDIQNTANAFWNTALQTQNWSMTELFGSPFSGAFTSVTTNVDVSAFGSFSIDGSNLTWQAIPEPTTALAGLLLAAGLLRRRRR